MDAEMWIDTQQHLFLYAYPAHQLQVGSRKGVDTRPSSVQERLLRYRQDCEKEPAVQRNQENQRSGPVAKAEYGFREGHVHVQLLHARNVLHRYGLPEKEVRKGTNFIR